MDAAEQGVRRGPARGLQRQAAARRRRQRRARHRRGPRLLRRPGLPGLPDQLGGRGRPGRLQPKPFALAAGIREGFSLKDTFEGNSPDRARRRHRRSRTRATSDYGSAVNLITATENSINTAFIDLTDSMDNGPEKIVEAGQPDGHPAGQGRQGPARLPEQHRRVWSRSPASRSAAPRSARSTWPTPTPPSPTSGRGRASPTSSRRSSTQTASTLYAHQVTDNEAHRTRTSPPTCPTPCSRSSRTAPAPPPWRSAGPAAGKTGTATNGDGRRRPRPGSPATRRSWRPR